MDKGDFYCGIVLGFVVALFVFWFISVTSSQFSREDAYCKSNGYDSTILGSVGYLGNHSTIGCCHNERIDGIKVIEKQCEKIIWD